MSGAALSASLARPIGEPFSLARRSAVAAAGASLLAAAQHDGCRRMHRADQISGRLAVRVAADGNQVERADRCGLRAQRQPAGRAHRIHEPARQRRGAARSGRHSRCCSSRRKANSGLPTSTSMSREVLGESIPVAALFDWLRGRPWPGAAAAGPVGGQGFRAAGLARRPVALRRFAGHRDAAMRARGDGACRGRSALRQRMRALYELPAPAKLNLFLHVIGRRPTAITCCNRCSC